MFRSNDYICKYHRSMLRLLLNNKLFLIAFENFPHLSNNVHGNSSRKNMNFKSFLSFCNFNDLQILYAKMQKNFIALNRNENSIYLPRRLCKVSECASKIISECYLFFCFDRFMREHTFRIVCVCVCCATIQVHNFLLIPLE